jgi:hypothetical protein
MATPSFADKIRSWDLRNNNLKPRLPDIPEAKDFQAQLEALIASAKTLDAEQNDLRGRLQETTRLRQETVLEGEDLKGRLAATLRARLGFKAEALLAFGLPPRRPRKRRTTAPADPTTPVQPAPEVATEAHPPTRIGI